MKKGWLLIIFVCFVMCCDIRGMWWEKGGGGGGGRRRRRKEGKGGIVLESVLIRGSVVSSSMFHLQE